MTRAPAVRRKQFSSCDSCRNSRVACDALTAINAEDTSLSRESCSRCKKQDKNCTFNVIPPSFSIFRIEADGHQPQWVQRHKTTHLKNRPTSHRNTPVKQIDHTANLSHLSRKRIISVGPNLQSNAVLVHGALWDIYHQNFEAMLGTWIAVCPCLDGYDMDSFRCDRHVQSIYGVDRGDAYLRTISITRLYVALDSLVAQGRNASDSTENNAIETAVDDSEKEYQLDFSLVKAIHSFSARWLYLKGIPSLNRPRPSYYDSLTRHFWRVARKCMLKAINIISYQSVLTLILFGLTPVPAGLDKGEEADGLTGQICMRLGLEMLHQLRVQLSAPQFHISNVLRSIKDSRLNTTAKDNSGEEFISIESAAYAAGMIFDNDPAIIEDCRFTLSSGLLGFDSEPIFSLFKPQTCIFHDETVEWRKYGFNVSNENVSRVILATATWTYYLWKIISIFKEALREGYDKNVVETAYTAVLNAIQTFKVTYRPLMDICERRLQFLPWRLKYGWYNTMLRYHLGILKLLEAIERSEQIDLLSSLETARSDSEQGAINVLKLGLGSGSPVPNSCSKITKSNGDPEPMNTIRTVSFIAIDPWPDNIIATIRLMSTAINRGRKNALIGPDAFDNLRSTLLQTVRELPRSSKHTHTALNSLCSSTLEKSEIVINPACSTLHLQSGASTSAIISTYDDTQIRIEHRQQNSGKEACRKDHCTPLSFADEGLHDLVVETNNVGLSRLGSLISCNDING